jgi:hypothetical protein
MPQLKLGVALPAYGSKLDVGHAAMWFGLGVAMASTQDKFTLHSFADYHVNGIDLCRNTILFDAIESGCDWVLMVDADNYHAAKADAIGDAGVDILQMILDGQRQEAAMVGAPVRGRGVGDTGVCVQNKIKDGWQAVSLEALKGQAVPVDRIGAAFIAVNVNWIKACWTKPPWFLMDHNFEGRPKHGRGEDYFFCDGIRDRGGIVLCDGRFVPEHVDRRKLVGES